MNNFLPFNDINVLERYIQSEQPLNIIDRSSDFTLFMFVCDKILNTQPYEPWAKIAMNMLNLTADQINLKYANRDGITALILVSGVDVEVSLKIIEFGPEAININAIENNNKMNALMYSCTKDTEEVALALLNYPQIVTSLKNINNNGYTPLMIACEEELEDVALTMLEKFPSANFNFFPSPLVQETFYYSPHTREEKGSIDNLESAHNFRVVVASDLSGKL
jgi:ankyrin repeat protein